MKAYEVSSTLDGWLDEGPPSLNTGYDYGWPSRVADIVQAFKDRKVKLLRSSSGSVEPSTHFGEE